MSSPLQADLFAEDRGHEEFLRPLIERLAAEQEKTVRVQIRSASGGHGRALEELSLYQKSVLRGIGGLVLPDLLVVAIDGNCNSLQDARKQIQDRLADEFQDRAILACPDPHVERWYMADLEAFQQVVGVTPKLGKQKCKRDWYKNLLAQSVAEAGHPAPLGGIEFATELVAAMNCYRAGRADNSLKHFLEEITSRFKI